MNEHDQRLLHEADLDFEEAKETFSLQGLINSHVAKLGEQKKEYKSWRASSIGGCPRKHFYARLGIEETSPPDARTQKVFEVGNIFHEYIQDIINEQGYAKEIEFEMYDKELDLGGRCDAIVKTDDGKEILYDIKTVHSRAFWHLEKSGKTLGEHYPHYVKQLGAYMLMLKRAGTPVDEGRILMVSKDDLMMKEVTFHLTPELQTAVELEVESLNIHWRDKTLPPCICHEMYNGNGPKYCQYKTPGKNACCDESLFKNHLTKEKDHA